VLQRRFSTGIRAGLISIAATSGVLVAYGLKARSLSYPFLFLGRHLGGFRDGIYPPTTVVTAGFLLHAAWVMAWCVAFAMLAAGAESRMRAILAVITVTLAHQFSSVLIGSALATSGLGGPRWLFLHIVFAVALYLGTQIAPREG
jgi:hypothetical protein